VYLSALLRQKKGQLNGLTSRVLFSKSYKIMVNKVTFVGLREGDRLNRPPGNGINAYCLVRSVANFG